MAGVAAGVVLALLPAAASALDLTAGAGAAQSCPDSSRGAAFTAAAVAYTEPAPVLSVTRYGEGHFDPSSGNNLGIGIGYSEASGRLAGFCIGVLYRAEFLAQASEDALQALVANHYGNPFTAGRTYALAIAEQTLVAEGVRARRIFQFDLPGQWTAQLGVGVSALKATQIERESLGGSITATSPTYAVGSITWLQTASNLNLRYFNPFVPYATPEGGGFSSDLELRVEAPGGSSADLVVVDALGRLYWRELPQSLRSLNNATVSYNINFDRDALVNGFDSRVDATQNLTPIYHLALETPLGGRWSALAADDLMAGYHFPSFGAEFRAGAQTLTADYDLRTRAVELGVKTRWIRVSVTSNALSTQLATTLGVTLQASCAW